MPIAQFQYTRSNDGRLTFIDTYVLPYDTTDHLSDTLTSLFPQHPRGTYLSINGALYMCCPPCGKFHLQSTGATLCPVCRETKARCSFCSVYAEKSEMLHCYIDSRHLDVYLCPRCQRDYTICPSCGSIPRLSGLIHEEGIIACRRCFDITVLSGGLIIQEHYHRPSLYFFPKTETPAEIYFGIEYECDGFSPSQNLYKALKPIKALLTTPDTKAHRFHVQNDSSLSDGWELVTQPCTLQYHRDTFPWREITSICKDLGAHPETNGSGLHVHFSSSFLGDPNTEALEENIVKTVHIVERFWSQIIKLSRRDLSNLEQWAGRYKFPKQLPDDFAKKDDAYGYSYARRVRNTNERHRARYKAVNVTNQSTIEIRLFKGTLNPSEVVAAVEFADLIARTAKILPIKDINTLKWSYLVAAAQQEYPALYAYFQRLSLTEEPKQPDYSNKNTGLPHYFPFGDAPSSPEDEHHWEHQNLQGQHELWDWDISRQCWQLSEVA